VILADAWTAVGGAAAVVAAAAALVTVYFARDTVIEARASRREARAAHAEQVRQETALLEATHLVHEQEMAERRVQFERELVLQRHDQLGTIGDLLRAVADIARSEITTRPPVIEGTPFTMTRTTGMLARLEAAIATFELLGGPPLEHAATLAKDGRMANTPPARILGDAMSALDAIAFLTRNEASLVLPANGGGKS
jgi:hypothetical protein